MSTSESLTEVVTGATPGTWASSPPGRGCGTQIHFERFPCDDEGLARGHREQAGSPVRVEPPGESQEQSGADQRRGGVNRGVVAEQVMQHMPGGPGPERGRGSGSVCEPL